MVDLSVRKDSSLYLAADETRRIIVLFGLKIVIE